MWYLRHFASEAKDVSSQEQLLFEQQLAVFRVTVIRLPELQLLLGCFPLRVNSHRNPVHTFHSEESIINWRAVLWIGILSMPIRIPLSILMPIQIRILHQVLHMLENPNKCLTFIHSNNFTLFFFLSRQWHRQCCGSASPWCGSGSYLSLWSGSGSYHSLFPRFGPSNAIQNDPLRIPPFHFVEDPDFAFTLIRILLFTLMRMRIRI